MKIRRLDHLVLTVRDIETTVAFYTNVLGMGCVTFADRRRALSFGDQKINLHSADDPITPHAAHPMPGSADICLISAEPIADVIKSFQLAGVAIEEGPVQRRGALGSLRSVYIRDPDGNLVEVSTYQPLVA
ncbi:MAG: VOC family protein [Chthoniobacterales bacterium]|nr:VOC family protein [Chthoniobacterales bacterium]